MSQLGLPGEIKHLIVMILGTVLPVLVHSDFTPGGVGILPLLFLEASYSAFFQEIIPSRITGNTCTFGGSFDEV